MRSPWILLAFVAACDVGSVNTPAPGPGPGGGGGPDAPPAAPGTPDAAPAAPGTPDGGGGGSQLVCKDGVNTADSGRHNPGTDCMTAGCHAPGGGGPTWTIAGTLYAAAGGGTPVAGATITVIDANGASHDLVSAQNGNFYTGVSIPLPAKVYASKCPAIQPMTETFSTGSCNSCHVAGGKTTPVHLP
jgi:hypothetical protein